MYGDLKIIIVLALSLNGYSQTKLDTINFKPIETRVIKSIEPLRMKTIDTLYKPNAYVLTNDINPDAIALKKGCKYLIFDLLPNSDYGYVTKTE